jgi:hypothetical protein
MQVIQAPCRALGFNVELPAILADGLIGLFITLFRSAIALIILQGADCPPVVWRVGYAEQC